MRHTFLSTLAKHKHKILPCALYHYSTSTYQIQAISAKFLVFYLLTLIHRFTLITVGVKFGFCWGKVWGVVVRRVLVLIQVAALRAARQAHALQQFDRRNIKDAPTDARSPLSRLANLRIFPSARTLILWTRVGSTICRQFAFFICLITSGLTSPIYTPSSKQEKLSKSRSF